jgi:dephospho-CoA kinase
MEKKKLIVAICGTLLAGKGVVVEILKSRGFQHISVRSLIKEELEKRDLPPTRKNLMDMGNLMRKEHGGQYWVSMALDKYKSYDAPLIIESLRNMSEVDWLRKNCNCFIIGVDAPFETRWERLKNRNVDADLIDYDKFVIDDARDRGFNEPSDGQQTAMLLVHADFLINNDENFTGSLENSKLNKEVNEIYRKITKNQK